MLDLEANVFVIDDDAAVRDALSRLLRSVGWSVSTHETPEDFLAQSLDGVLGCILLDVAMPGITGPQLHRMLRSGGITLPVIYLTGQGTLRLGVDAMKFGAHDFLEKPVDDDVLLLSVQEAVANHRVSWALQDRLGGIHQRLSDLSPREREVMDHVITGRLNKQIAADLGIAEKTVKVHRGRVMAKMKVRSVAQLVHLCDAVGLGA